MNISEAKQMLSIYMRDGYRICEHRHSDGVEMVTTVYLFSHKKRAVGAVNISSDGSIVAESPREAYNWAVDDGIV